MILKVAVDSNAPGELSSTHLPPPFFPLKYCHEVTARVVSPQIYRISVQESLKSAKTALFFFFRKIFMTPSFAQQLLKSEFTFRLGFFSGQQPEAGRHACRRV